MIVSQRIWESVIRPCSFTAVQRYGVPDARTPGRFPAHYCAACYNAPMREDQPCFGPVENECIVAEYTLTDNDIQLIGDVRSLVRGNPDKFSEAGVWLDHHYSFMRCAVRDRKFYRTNNALDQFDVERSQSKNLRLRAVVSDLLEGPRANAILLPTVDTAYRVLLICWLLTDPEANEYKPKLTEFQDWSLGSLSHDLMQLCSDGVVSDWEQWWVLCRKAWQVVPKPQRQLAESPPLIIVKEVFTAPIGSEGLQPTLDVEPDDATADLSESGGSESEVVAQRLEAVEKQKNVTLNSYEQDIVDALSEKGNRMTTEPLLKKAVGNVNSHGKANLASLRKRGIIDNKSDAHGKGYGLPSWSGP